MEDGPGDQENLRLQATQRRPKQGAPEEQPTARSPSLVGLGALQGHGGLRFLSHHAVSSPPDRITISALWVGL